MLMILQDELIRNSLPVYHLPLQKIFITQFIKLSHKEKKPMVVINSYNILLEYNKQVLLELKKEKKFFF